MPLVDDNPPSTGDGTGTTDPGAGGGGTTDPGTPDSPPKIFNVAVSCDPLLGSILTFVVNKAMSGTSCSVGLVDSDGNSVWGDGFGTSVNARSFRVEGILDGDYTIEADNGLASSSVPVTIACGNVSSPDALKLAVAHTDETAALQDGTITLTPSGGTAPLTLELVDLRISRLGTAGTPEFFDKIDPNTYAVRVTDANGAVANSSVTVLPYSAPKDGCQDEYATNYDPAATSDAACTYEPLWRSVWGPTNVAVAVPAVAGQMKHYIEAELFIGFRPGHPLAASRPLGEPIPLRATVGPQGFAVFQLGPYLRPTLGAPDGLGGYRLDLNSYTARIDDLYVGYELRRAVTAELLEHGYALNAAVPDAQLSPMLSPFAEPLPVWPSFDYIVTTRSTERRGFGVLGYETPDGIGDVYAMPCPANPLPVAWLAPGGGYGYWVFQGRPQLGDDVGEGQTFTEAGTGERRFSQRGETRGTITASTGIFNGPRFGEGLRTLWASPQVWYQPQLGGEWVPVTLGSGSFPLRRLGLARTEVSLTFTEARPHYAQGQ
jgi:hypothetical protein